MNTFRLTRPGIDARVATSPNDFLFGPDWNTPKIIKEASVQPTLGTTGSETFYNLAHGLNYTPFSTGFVKFADNYVGLIGSKARGVEFFSTALRINSTNIRFGYNNFTGGNYSPTFKYLAFEIPLAGTPSISEIGGNRIIIAKTGFDARTELNPNNKIYDSRFGTLKYFDEGATTIVNPSGTPAANVDMVNEVVLATHNLGYYPSFGGNFEYSVTDPGRVYLMPLGFADSGFWEYHTIYATTTQLIYRAEAGNSIGGIGYSAQTVKIYWKLHSKDLNL